MEKPFQLAARARSFRFAFAGFRTLLATQPNAWIHTVVTTIVVLAAALLRVSRGDWCWLVAAIAAVWAAEAGNTALEFLADAVASAPNPLVGRAKDCAAAAVLLAAAGAVAVGSLVLAPYLCTAFGR